MPVSALTDEAYEEAMSAVCERLSVNSDHSHRNNECQSVEDLVVNGNNEALWQAAKAMGSKCFPIARNVKGCKDCSACERGCPYGGK